jgi:hypothetical protein
MNVAARQRKCSWLLALLVVACSTTPEPTTSCEQRAVRAQTCIRVQDLAEWESVDDEAVLVWPQRANRAHLLRLNQPMAALLLTDEIDVLDRDLDQLICPCGRDAVSVAGPGGGTALISSSEYLSERRLAELLGSSSFGP